MKELKEQQKMRKKIRARKEWPRRKAKLIATVFALAFLTIYFGHQHYKDIVMSKKIREARAEQNIVKKKVQSLKDEKVKLRDPAHLKEIARKELYMMKEDEELIQITKPANKNTEKKEK